MPDKLTMIVSMAVFVLLIAFVLPTVITASDGTGSTEVVLQSGETQTVTEGLEVTAEATGNNEATISLANTQTGDEDNATITEGTTAELNVSNETINVTNEASTNDQVELMITYPRTFGWGEGGKAFLDNFELILAGLAVLIVAGTIRGVLNS